jgi:hypothetical protein
MGNMKSCLQRCEQSPNRHQSLPNKSKSNSDRADGSRRSNSDGDSCNRTLRKLTGLYRQPAAHAEQTYVGGINHSGGAGASTNKEFYNNSL